MNYSRVNYHYQGIMGYDFFKKLKKNENLCKEVLFDNIIDPNISSRCNIFLSSVFFNKNPWGVITVKTKDYEDNIDLIIDGKKRIQLLSQIYLEDNERRTDYKILYNPLLNSFVNPDSEEYNSPAYPLNSIYDTFKMIQIDDEIKKSDKYTEAEKKIIHNNLVEFNAFWQNLVFEICWYNDDYEKEKTTSLDMIKFKLNKSINNE